jgi:hypothetical protein
MIDVEDGGGTARAGLEAHRDRVVALALAAHERGALDDDACAGLLDAIVGASTDAALQWIEETIPGARAERAPSSPVAACPEGRPTGADQADDAPHRPTTPSVMPGGPDPVDLLRLARRAQDSSAAASRSSGARWTALAAIGVVFLLLAVGGLYLALSVHAPGGP